MQREGIAMIQRDDILSMEYLKKTEYTGCHQGMRYRLEGAEGEEGKVLRVTVWPEPFNFFTTPKEKKTSAVFAFAEEGVLEAVDWMNRQFTENKEKWENSWNNWSDYKMEM